MLTWLLYTNNATIVGRERAARVFAHAGAHGGRPGEAARGGAKGARLAYEAAPWVL